MKRPNARARADLAPLTVATIRKVVLSMYHRRHDYGTDADIAELLQVERVKMPRAQTLDMRAQGGRRGLDVLANASYYGIGGLVRISMEHEFGFETMLPFHEIRHAAMELDAEAQT